MKPRSKLLKPNVPGGYLDDPPEGCPNAVSYCPDADRYESILIVDYVMCVKRYCSVPSICQRRLEADKGLSRRLSRLKGNGDELD